LEEMGALNRVSMPGKGKKSCYFSSNCVLTLARQLHLYVNCSNASRKLGIDQHQLASLRRAGLVSVLYGNPDDDLQGLYEIQALDEFLSQIDQLTAREPENTSLFEQLSRYEPANLGLLVQNILRGDLQVFKARRFAVGLAQYDVPRVAAVRVLKQSVSGSAPIGQHCATSRASTNPPPCS
jgi:hypothetical protein